ncbi:MAG: hypothetical protein Q4C95_01065 [Planctomycetia bacterium]|nr:hypothetical protein [Planctomycetia bacterium]
MRSNNLKRTTFGAILFSLLIGILACTGCQLTQNGQTLPNPDYLNNNIQYHPSGNEFQYQQEVNWMEKERANRQLESHNFEMQ